MLRPRHGMVDPRRLTSRTFAPLLYAITRQPSSFSSFARARAAEGLGDCHNALRANSIPAGFLACPDVLDHASLRRLVSAHGSDLLPPPAAGRSGMTCPRCQQENPPQAKFCLECATPLRLPPDGDGEALNVARRLAEALRREQEAREQQAATSDILRVISNSPNDVQPVFDAIVASAVDLCHGVFSTAFRFDGERIHLAA